jgi:hypothetical protein
MPKFDKKPRKRSQPASRNKDGKVGSDPAADREIGGELDFGYSAAHVKAPLPDGGREKGPEQGTGPMRSGEDGNRVYGVAHPPGPPGTGSGGDLDPDIIGLDGRGGVARDVDERRTSGPDIIESGTPAPSSGQQAQGKNQIRPGTHGAAPEVVRGSTVDRSGGDASTSGGEE